MTKKNPPAHSSVRVLRQSLGIALKDLWHDRRTTLVLVLTVAAIVAPLLLLFGLKNGVVTTLRQNLLQDPRNREVVVYGSTRLTQDWFQAYRARADVGFLIPKTRTINATVDLVNAQRRIIPAVEVIPTADGDPLLPEHLPVPGRPFEVLVTEALADKLRVGSGLPLFAVIKRSEDGMPQHVKLPLDVLGIVPGSHFSRDALFTTIDLLAAAEDYRDGVLAGLTAADSLDGYAANRGHFANARVYAADLDSVAVLAAAMRGDGIEIRTQSERIATVQAFDRILSFVFRVIALIGSLGCALALGGALWVNVDRKRRDLALMRLFGFDNWAVASIPAVQSLVITIFGFLLAAAAYLIGSDIFNRVLGQNLVGSGYVCRLDAGDMVTAAALALLVALVAAVAGGVRARSIAPAESLRDV